MLYTQVGRRGYKTSLYDTTTGSSFSSLFSPPPSSVLASLFLRRTRFKRAYPSRFRESLSFGLLDSEEGLFLLSVWRRRTSAFLPLKRTPWRAFEEGQPFS